MYPILINHNNYHLQLEIIDYFFELSKYQNKRVENILRQSHFIGYLVKFIVNLKQEYVNYVYRYYQITKFIKNQFTFVSYLMLDFNQQQHLYKTFTVKILEYTIEVWDEILAIKKYFNLYFSNHAT